MIFTNDTDKNGVVSQKNMPGLGWKDRAPSKRLQNKGRRRLIIATSVLLLIMLIFATLRMFSVASGTDDQLSVRIGNQQTAIVDLRQSLPVSPYLYGVNVFPEIDTSSVDKSFTGFMSYAPPVVEGLQATHIKLLRFPGGDWGERTSGTDSGHILSLDQLYRFGTLLKQTGADGMIQARLSNPIDGSGRPADLATRANEAGRWVDFMNNPKSDLRTHPYKGSITPVKFWTVGNEPDLLINPETNKKYTVAQYVNDFIQYSLDMHQNDPTIKVFGPEISQFYGIAVGPKDAFGHLWLEEFLKGVAAYEQKHPELKYNLLDGVSFHRYPFDDARQNTSLLLSSPGEWNYLLPPLRQMIRQIMRRDLPIAVTEINTNPKVNVPTRGTAALWWADTLGTLMNQQVEYVGFFSAEGVPTPYPLFTQDGLYQTPMFRVLQLFSHMQPNLVPVDTQRDPISVYATQDETHQTVSLMFINKSIAPQLVQISSENQLFNISPWHSLDVSLLGYSIVVVTLHRGGGAQAYSYQAPAPTDDTTKPLMTTICGKKVDALRNDIPC